MKKLTRSFQTNTFRRASDFDVAINMAPMIDFLIIVITYLLISTTYCSVGLIDSVAQGTSGGTALSSEAQSGVRLGIVIRKDHCVELKANGLEPVVITLGTQTNEDVARKVQELVKSSPVEAISLNAEDGIEYGEIVGLLSRLRTDNPLISLSVDKR